MNENRTIRYGILGTARIAERVSKAIQEAEGAELCVVGSRSAEKAESWASERSIPRSCGSYEAVLDDDEIDAVYIPLPPSMHYEWTIRAAEKGKHVLCEKPVALYASQAAQMAEACAENNVQFMDGVMWLHHPRSAEMFTRIQDGTLGDLRRVTSAFSFNREFPLDDLRMQRSMGGGALGDIGWYCIGASLWAFDAMPQRVQGFAKFENDVDINFSGTMWFDGDRVATFDCSFNTVMRRWLEIAGTEASLVCDDFTRAFNENKPRFWTHGAEGKLSEHHSSPKIQEVFMIENFCAAIRSGQLREDWATRAVQTQQVCDALDRSARDKTIVSV